MIHTSFVHSVFLVIVAKHFLAENIASFIRMLSPLKWAWLSKLRIVFTKQYAAISSNCNICKISPSVSPKPYTFDLKVARIGPRKPHGNNSNFNSKTLSKRFSNNRFMMTIALFHVVGTTFGLPNPDIKTFISIKTPMFIQNTVCH